MMMMMKSVMVMVMMMVMTFMFMMLLYFLSLHCHITNAPVEDSAVRVVTEGSRRVCFFGKWIILMFVMMMMMMMFVKLFVVMSMLFTVKLFMFFTIVSSKNILIEFREDFFHIVCVSLFLVLTRRSSRLIRIWAAFICVSFKHRAYIFSFVVMAAQNVTLTHPSFLFVFFRYQLSCLFVSNGIVQVTVIILLYFWTQIPIVLEIFEELVILTFTVPLSNLAFLINIASFPLNLTSL